ncbi:MAG: DUF2273 domain-containing protein [Bacillota bacterium]|nr:DUF2273 domain-containing protein [Bacillota bacterium]
MREDYRWWEIWARHRGKIVGTFLGLAFGFLTYWVGIWWALFIAGAGLFGYWVGREWDEEQRSVAEWVERLLPPRWR